jgi:hypothetical protein
MNLLCLSCCRLDLPGLLPLPLPAWSKPGPVACAVCGVVGEHRLQAIPLKRPEPVGSSLARSG